MRLCAFLGCSSADQQQQANTNSLGQNVHGAGRVRCFLCLSSVFTCVTVREDRQYIITHEFACRIWFFKCVPANSCVLLPRVFCVCVCLKYVYRTLKHYIQRLCSCMRALRQITACGLCHPKRRGFLIRFGPISLYTKVHTTYTQDVMHSLCGGVVVLSYAVSVIN